MPAPIRHESTTPLALSSVPKPTTTAGKAKPTTAPTAVSRVTRNWFCIGQRRAAIASPTENRVPKTNPHRSAVNDWLLRMNHAMSVRLTPSCGAGNQRTNNTAVLNANHAIPHVSDVPKRPRVNRKSFNCIDTEGLVLKETTLC